MNFRRGTRRRWTRGATSRCRTGASLFSAGLLLALPLVASLLAINLAMGVLNRSAPQLSVFSIGFPLTLLLGIAMLWLMMPGMTDWLSLLFRQALGAFQAVHEGLGTMP